MPETKTTPNNLTQDGPVTVIITRRVKPNREAECEAWFAGITQAALGFEGHLGVNIIRPHDHKRPEYVVVFRFDTYENLRRWEDSPLRAEWLRRAAPFTEGETEVQKITGLEYWFTLPQNPLRTPPPRYKMALVTAIALYPLVNTVGPLLAPFTGNWPAFLQSLLPLLIVVALMTYLVMPLMTRLFAFWLYPRP